MSYLIYGKVCKEMNLPNGHGGVIRVQPQAQFRALDYNGKRVNKLSDADDYATREDAQEVIDRALENHRKKGQEGCVEFQIRKAK